MTDWLPMVTTSGPAEDALDVEKLREWCRVDSAFDADTIEDLGLTAVEHIEAYTGTKLFTQTIKLRCSCFSERMPLPVAPIREITSVEYLDANGATQMLDPSSYEELLYGLSPAIVRAYDQSWPNLRPSRQAVTITAVAGYGAFADVPRPVRHAVQLLVSQWFDNRMPINVGNIVNELPHTVAALLANHRIYSFG